MYDNAYALHSHVYEYAHGSDSRLSEILHRRVSQRLYPFFELCVLLKELQPLAVSDQSDQDDE